MGKNSIVLVTVDCLRADHVGFMGYHRPTTPFLDILAAESFVFPAAIVAGTPTYYSFPAIMASRFPLALGRDVVGLAPGEPCLASILKNAGYSSAAFVAANPYISSRFGYDQGFDTFCDFLSAGSELPPPEVGVNASPKGWFGRINQKIQSARPRLGPLRVVYDELYFQYCQRATSAPNSLDELRKFPAAETIIERGCKWMDSAGERPIFLWLHLMDPHSPYYPKHEALSLLGDSPVSTFRARYLNSHWNRSDLGPRRLSRHREEITKLYDAGVRWVDLQLSRLVDYLKATNRWNQCVFAVSADHGEEFLDHDGRFHSPSHLADELIRVPLLLRVPGFEKKQLSNAPFSMLDLAPTLLNSAGIESPGEFDGKSRWQQIHEGMAYETTAITECVVGCTNPVPSENRLGPRALSVREKRFKLVFHFSGAEEKLYDLEADPGEQAPLAPEAQKSVRKRLLEIAHEHVRNSIAKRNTRARIRALLRDLQLESTRFFPQRAS